jgi:hypothetical protein
VRNFSRRTMLEIEAYFGAAEIAAPPFGLRDGASGKQNPLTPRKIAPPSPSPSPPLGRVAHDRDTNKNTRRPGPCHTPAASNHSTSRMPGPVRRARVSRTQPRPTRPGRATCTSALLFRGGAGAHLAGAARRGGAERWERLAGSSIARWSRNQSRLVLRVVGLGAMGHSRPPWENSFSLFVLAFRRHPCRHLIVSPRRCTVKRSFFA